MAYRLEALLPREEQERVLAAIREAEGRTSGQIKVHVEPRCRKDAMDRARALFVELGLVRTRHRNAVLLYVAPLDRKFAVVGDEGIHQRANGGTPLWEHAAAAMKQHFGRGALGEGLVAAIAAVGAVLASEFPPEAGGANEISDEISGGSDGGRGR